MPLEKAAPGTPGFKRNIKREMAAGKPQKQAVAIAFAKSRDDDMPPDIHSITNAVRHVLADATPLGETQTMPDDDGPLRLEIEHLSDTDKEKLSAACDRADSMSTRLAQLEKRDSLRRIPR